MQQLLETGTSPKARYRNACEQSGFVFDTRQTAAIEELETLWHQLVEFKAGRNQFLGRSLLSPAVPKGLYIWGGVGRGKTFLMDGFTTVCRTAGNAASISITLCSRYIRR